MEKSNFIGFCSKFYDKKGRRGSFFAELFGNQLVITSFWCSKQDLPRYSKKFAWDIWKAHFGLSVSEIKEKFGVTLNQTTIQISSDKPGREFIDYLTYNYFKYGPVPCVLNQLVPAVELQYYQIISQGLNKKK